MRKRERLRFQSNHQRGYFLRKRIMSSRGRKRIPHGRPRPRVIRALEAEVSGAEKGRDDADGDDPDEAEPGGEPVQWSIGVVHVEGEGIWGLRGIRWARSIGRRLCSGGRRLGRSRRSGGGRRVLVSGFFHGPPPSGRARRRWFDYPELHQSKPRRLVEQQRDQRGNSLNVALASLIMGGRAREAATRYFAGRPSLLAVTDLRAVERRVTRGGDRP